MSDKNRSKISRWLPAGKTISKALLELTSHRIQIDEHTVIENDCYIEDAVTIGNFIFLGDQVLIGNHTALESDAAVGPGTTIGHHCVIGSKSFIGRRCQIGNFSVIGPNTSVLDDIFLPPHTVVLNRKLISRSESLTAIFSTKRKVKSYFGSDAVFVYDDHPDPSLENDMTFTEFIKEAHITSLADILENQEKEQFKREITALVSTLHKIILLKQAP